MQIKTKNQPDYGYYDHYDNSHFSADPKYLSDYHSKTTPSDDSLKSYNYINPQYTKPFKTEKQIKYGYHDHYEKLKSPENSPFSVDPKYLYDYHSKKDPHDYSLKSSKYIKPEYRTS